MIATDTEVFLKDPKTGKHISSVGLIGGDKHSPLIVQGGNLQEDNVLAEFAIDPADDLTTFIANIEGTYAELEKRMAVHGLILDISSSALYDDSELQTPEAMLFGCTPDFNAYTMLRNTPPDPETVGALRSCGGHVHVSFDEIAGRNVNDKAAFIRILDLYLGIPSLLMDNDTARRQLYGQAGAYRMKEYGIEYRTLSNFWIQSKEHMAWCWNQVKRAEMKYLDGYRVTSDIGNSVMSIINKNDLKSADHFVELFDLEVVNG